MFIQVYGKYLVDKGVVSERVIKTLLEKTNQTRVKMGTIAVAEGMITEFEAQEINDLQTKLDARFGDIAVERGYLTEEQIDEIIAKQGNISMKFIQLLSEEAGISMGEIDAYLNEYKKENGFNDEEFEALKNDDVDKVIGLFAPVSNPLIPEIAALVIKNITRFVTSDFYFERIKRASDFSYELLAGQRSEGEHNIFLGFMGDMDGLMSVASGYSGEVEIEAGDEAIDAVCEFANLINGLVAIALGNKKVSVDMEPPVAFEGQTANGTAYVMPFVIKGEEINLVISVDDDFVPGTEVKVLSKKVSDSNADGNILIADDSSLIRKLLREILESYGYKIAGEATNGFEAVEMYKKLKPALVTLDITMPEMDGVEALEKIKEIDSEAEVIMITAAGQEERLISALKAGAKQFITKPIDKEEIIKQVRSILG